MGPVRWWGPALAWGAIPWAAVAGQTIEVEAGVHALRLTRETEAVAHASGATFGIGGRIGMGVVGLRLGYRQGSLSGDAGAVDQDVVEGEALFAVRPVPWLAGALGPHIRAYIDPDGSTERWVLWEARLDASARLVGRVTGFLETWRALGSSINAAGGIGTTWGLEGGLRAPIPGTPLRVTLGYRSEYARLSAGTRQEALEQIGVTLTFHHP